VPTGTGESRTLKVNGFELSNWIRWFPDGKRILVSGQEQSKRRFYVLSVDGTPARPITPAGMAGWRAAISPDGTRIAATGPDRKLALYPAAGGDARPLAG